MWLWKALLKRGMKAETLRGSNKAVAQSFRSNCPVCRLGGATPAMARALPRARGMTGGHARASSAPRWAAPAAPEIPLWGLE
eukprot:CAMPEP_0179054434 /NCGR_PEP_ID=MMETSP0796-20121207/22783_1 /TAXON_ID=73915 /ORGANISM="Pyrodinium bahamense, Strain pbaha01" /LENGTH=81 /DNA_ID=CAMNT_0020751055 /DNA_START=1998 /DNA_END=2240 /DNA_ORIENTATION=+